jgi:L-threonylcarbamoyladenylate synthase
MKEYPTIYPLNSRTYRRTKRLILSGELVAFPTETVYGLGANALDPVAVNKIFQWKGRPINNPVIVHFSKVSQLNRITDLTRLEKKALGLIGAECWPGPLTLVLRASDIVPKEITAGKNFVGVRMPNDSVALKLIDECGCLIAAPSANLSGHCSPYSANHVANDFYNRNLCILDDSENRNLRYGIESTVIKLEEITTDFLKITVLRTGIIGGNLIRKILQKNNIEFNLEYYTRVVDVDTAMDCPGQLFRHYAPNIPAYIEQENTQKTITQELLQGFVIIGANGSLANLKHKCLKYFDLGISIIDVAKNIYSLLRLAEQIEGAKGIIISVQKLDEFADKNSDLDMAIHDKLMRCSEGHSIRIV